VATLFLWIAPLSYGAYGMVMVMNASFNGMGRPLPAVVVSLSRMALIYVPLALLGNYLFAIPGIFAAYAVANIVTGFAAYAWARSCVQAQCDRHEHRTVIAAPGDPVVARYATASDITRRT